MRASAEYASSYIGGMSILDTAKSVVGLAAEVGKMDLHKQAVDLMAQVTEQQQRIMRLTADVAALHEQLRMKEAIIFDKNAYWQALPRESGSNTKDQVGPF